MDISVSAALYYDSPLIFALCVLWLFRGEARYRRMGAVEIGLFVIAIAGAGLVVASQVNGFSLGGGSWDLLRDFRHGALWRDLGAADASRRRRARGGDWWQRYSGASVGAGLLTGMIASLLWRTAILIASDIGVAVVRYLMPVALLGWLLALGLIGDVDLWLLGCCAALIICANGGVGWRMRG